MSQVRLEWIIVKVHDELQHLCTPDSREERGKQSLELGNMRSGSAHRKGIQSEVGPGPPLLTCWHSGLPPPRVELQPLDSCWHPTSPHSVLITKPWFLRDGKVTICRGEGDWGQVARRERFQKQGAYVLIG